MKIELKKETYSTGEVKYTVHKDGFPKFVSTSFYEAEKVFTSLTLPVTIEIIKSVTI